MNRAERRRRDRKISKKYSQPWRENSGYPKAKRGAWEGVKEIRKMYERRFRRNERDSLNIGEEPEPIRTKSRAKWDLF